MTARPVRWLAIMACLQLGAIALLYWPAAEPDRATADGHAALLPLPREAVSRIGVTDASGNSVALVRRDDQWLIEQAALPAYGAVADRLLDALAQPSGFPVARSDRARERFEVGETRFQRRITLGTDGPEAGAGERADTAIFYLGTSAGMRRVHARRGGSAAIQAITLSTFDVPATVDGWLDPSLLATGGIERLQLGDRNWIKLNNTWTVAGTDAAAGAASANALDAVEQVLTTLQVTGVAAWDTGAADPGTRLQEWRLWQGDEAIHWRLASAAGNRDARISRSGLDHWFTLSSYDHDRLADALEGLQDAQADPAVTD